MNLKSLVVNEEVPIHTEDWGTLQWLISGKGESSETMTVGRVTIHPGMRNPHHYHPNCSEVLLVVSGTVEHTLPDGQYVGMKPGDSIVIPQGVWHHAKNVGEDEVVVIVIFDSAYRETVGE